jgi:hypothetical protein
MNDLSTKILNLPSLVASAASQLAEASTSAEVLEAKTMAGVAYDAAKSAGRIARMKEAHDDLLAKIYRSQAQCIIIEGEAQARLADEYDLAVKDNKVQGHGGARNFKVGDDHLEIKPSTFDVGLTKEQIYQARKVRDVLREDPTAIEDKVNALVEQGLEPTKAAIREQLQQVMQNPSVLRQSQPHQKKHVVPEDYTDFASFFSLCDKAADWDVDATAKYQNKKIQGLINSLQGKVDAAIKNLKKYKEIYDEAL